MSAVYAPLQSSSVEELEKSISRAMQRVNAQKETELC